MKKKGKDSAVFLLERAREEWRQGKPDKARNLVKEAMGELERDSAFPEELLPETLCQAGALFAHLEMMKDAENAYLRALSAAEDVYGKESLQTAVCLGSLASIRYYQGRFQEAEVFSRRALLAADRALAEEAGPWNELRSAMRFVFKQKREIKP